MKKTHWSRVLATGLFVAICISWTHGSAQTALSDGYMLEDYGLDAAGDLVDICTLGPIHDDYVAARAFCYGFFEGATHYDDALSSSPDYKRLICAPNTTTRTEAVDAFVAYMQANPRYRSEAPIDAIFRALIAKWPCGG